MVSRGRIRTYHGACACGAVRFVVSADPAGATRCICPRCRGQDLRVAYAPRAAFTLLTGADRLTEPLSHPVDPHHFFCATCGEAAFGFAPGGQSVSVNMNCLSRGRMDGVAEMPGAPA